ncbi:glycosyltransferase [Mucilaginibacter robiniae]|uniref:Glycosyltransferase n=1 Tax=Mucilaginibacter robiniae TaxID=2728022 RepID=A0A7L5EAX6_9SPHI|nr:glycosyltransferase family 2 protein [Mucilaginibacter robiniae]QJD97546.1 glycosyltransferase [Mucilaginibacter robiniae]
MPQISVVLPVYNSEKYIKAAIESVLNQTFTDFELIIINDASTDNTKQILETFTDKRIRLIHNAENLKVVKCLNLGLSLAQGEFIARMDADDISLPQRFKRQLSYLLEHSEVDICSSYVQVFGTQNYILRPYEDHESIKAGLLFLNLLIHPSIMFRRKSIIQFNVCYDEAYANAEDYGLWVAVMDKLKFGAIPEILFKYRIHDTNISIKKASNWPILHKINLGLYKILLDRMQLRYTDNDLEMHINLGFRSVVQLTKNDYRRYLNWLARIVQANNNSKYFNSDSLRNYVLSYVLYLTSRAKVNPIIYWELLQTLKKLYGIRICWNYLQLKLYSRLITFKQKKKYVI